MAVYADDFDIYQSDLAKYQLDRDAADYRRSLYTNTKADHPADSFTGEPCDCEAGGAGWERGGTAMAVLWPPEATARSFQHLRDREAAG